EPGDLRKPPRQAPDLRKPVFERGQNRFSRNNRQHGLVAIAIFKVCREDREMGLSHLIEINILAKIELMIAGNENIEPHVVEEIDHMRALVEARQLARRQRIAGRSEERRVGKECRAGWSEYHR